MLLETAIQRVKLTKWIGFVLKLLVTGVIIFFAWQQVNEHCSWLAIKDYVPLVLSSKSGFGLLLILVSFWNWGAESRKWQLLLPTVISFRAALESVLIGLGVSMFMPRVAGESIGRYMTHTGDKKEVVSGLLLSKVFQTGVTFIGGVFGFLFYFNQLSSFVSIDIRTLYVILIIALGVGVLYLIVLKKRLFLPFLAPLQQLNFQKVARLFFWTFIRYSSFVGQVFFVLWLFGIPFDFVSMLFGLMVMYGIRLATVSFNVMVDLGIRFSTAIVVLQHLKLISDVNSVVAVFTLVWLVNIVLPSVIGGVLISVRRWK